MIMLTHLRVFQALAISAAVALAGLSGARADTAHEKYYRAFYLEQAEGKNTEALKLYEEVVADAKADADLKTLAKARLAGLREEVVATDFARLMPPTALAYVELNRPGEQLSRLLDQLGLLATAEQSAAAAGERVAISPVLIKELFGLRGIAAAVTGFDPNKGAPSGVAVIHPGNLELIRGLIETALPVSAQPVDSIDGFPTYDVEGEALVTLTKRLIIVSQQRGEISDVIARMRDGGDSLATNPALADELKGREDALLFFCVNIKPVLPLIQMGMAAGASQSRELAMAQAVLDLKSLDTIVGRAGVSNDGVFLDLGLKLDKGHRNLVYNFMRMPPIDGETLKMVPQRSAAFLAAALNEANSRYSPTPPADPNAPPIVTAMDLGREIFANIIGVAAFVSAPEAKPAAGAAPIPDVGLTMSVHDPAKTEAIWTQFLGLAATAIGTGVMEGTRSEIAGASVRSFRFPEKITVYFATQGNHVVIGTSESVIARSLGAVKSGDSILKDPAFAKTISRIGPSSTLAAFAHASRCAELARPYMSAGEAAEMDQFVGTMKETVGSLVISQSDQVLGVSLHVTGLPKIGGVVAKLIQQERRGGEQRRLAARAEQAQDWDQFYELAQNDAMPLNNAAWSLLTDRRPDARQIELALRFAERANELTGHSNWMFVDTLALAHFENGDVQKAITLERKAVELAGSDPRRKEAEAALARFEAALAKATTGGTE